MYAAAGAWAAAMGASGIGVRRPQDGDVIWFDWTVARDRSQQTIGAKFYLEQEGRTTVLSFEGTELPTNRLTEAAQSWLATVPSDEVRTLLVTGRGSVFHYATAGAIGVRAGFLGIACHSPIEIPELIAVWGQPAFGDAARALTADSVGKRRAFVLGVVGDPNCGKSMLSHALAEGLRSQGWRAWRIDCDVASPTPKWFLEMQGNFGETSARGLRLQQKRGWSEALVMAAVQQVTNARRDFDVLVADFPGGRHNIEPVQRIPCDRVELFKLVDGFVILERDGSGTAAGWQKALSEIGLRERIVSVLRSASPEGSPAWELYESETLPLRGMVSGLRRPTPDQPFPAKIAELGPQLVDGLARHGCLVPHGR